MKEDQNKLIEGTRQYFEAWRILYVDKPLPKGLKYRSYTEYIFDNGTFLSTEPYTNEEEEYLLKLFKTTGPAKLKFCYQNATHLYLAAYFDKQYPDIAYGEGIGNNGILTVEHAVFVLNNKPVDVTWREENWREGRPVGNSTRAPQRLLARAKYCLRTNAYYMVKFGHKEVIDAMVETNQYGVIRPALCKEE